jgi:hypothetical protein
MLCYLQFLAELVELKAAPALAGARPCNGCPFDRTCDHINCRIA